MFRTKFVAKIKTHSIFHDFFFENLALCETTRKDTEWEDRQYDTAHALCVLDI